MTSTDDCIRLIEDLVAFPTVSRDPNKDLISYVVDYLAGEGVSSDLIWNDTKTKANLWATIGPADCPGVILSGHSDVVPVDGQAWSSDPFRVRRADGRLYGRGTCDMKGFIGIVLALVPELVKSPLKTPIHIAISYDEELGCTGVRSLVDRIAKMPVQPKLCIAGEPTMMQLVTGHKSGTVYKAVVQGTAAHSSLAPQAVNAIEFAAELVREITAIARELAETGDRDPAYDVQHSTLAVNKIEGGSAFNIIPEHCEIVMDMRALPALDTEAVIDRIEGYCREVLEPKMRAVAAETGITLEKIVDYPGLAVAANHPALTFMKRLLQKNDETKVAFGTEAGTFNALGGVVSVVCGPGSIEQAHKADEFLALTEIGRCLAFLQRLTQALEMEEIRW